MRAARRCQACTAFAPRCGVEIAVFALHAFVHLAQHHVGFGAEALLVGAQASAVFQRRAKAS